MNREIESKYFLLLAAGMPRKHLRKFRFVSESKSHVEYMDFLTKQKIKVCKEKKELIV